MRLLALCLLVAFVAVSEQSPQCGAGGYGPGMGQGQGQGQGQGGGPGQGQGQGWGPGQGQGQGWSPGQGYRQGGSDMRDAVKEVLGFVKELIMGGMGGMDGKGDGKEGEKEAPSCPRAEVMPIPCSVTQTDRESRPSILGSCGEGSECTVGPVTTALTPNWEYMFCTYDCKEIAAKIAEKKLEEAMKAEKGDDDEGKGWSGYSLEELIYFKKALGYQENIAKAYVEACARDLPNGGE